MEWLEEINYTVIEPKNDYRSDIYSPWQTKLQLEIWQEVNKEKIKKWAMNIILDTTPTTKTIRIKTWSKNKAIEFSVINLNDFKKDIWLLMNNITDQRTCTEWLWNLYEENYYEKWKIFKFDNCEWKITRLLPWRFELEIKGTKWVILNYTAYNIPFNI